MAICAAAAVAQADPTAVQHAQLRASLQRDLDDYLRKRSVAEHVSSLSLAVSLGRDQRVIAVTSGTTSYRGKSPVSPASLYQIGSNTKAFTAVAVLQLEAQGRLSIDAPLGTYLPQYPAYRSLTLRRLLNMTSGLESYDNTLAWAQAYMKNPMADASSGSLIRLVYPKIKFPPGTKYYYSNTGYLLAQEVVAARSRSKSFGAEMTRIIAAAGLKNTAYTSNVYPPAIARRVVAGYYENDDAGMEKLRGTDVSAQSLSWAQGAGSIVSTPADLATWARTLYTSTSLLPPKERSELFDMISTKTAQPATNADKADPRLFGLGVAQIFEPSVGAFWFYQGETLGFRAAHLYFPKSDLVLCLFANSRPVESKSELQALTKTLLADIKANPR